MTCSKCGNSDMYREDDRRANMVIHVCFKCGNRIYQGLSRDRNAGILSERWSMVEDGLSGQ